MVEKLSETIEAPSALDDRTLSAEARALYLTLARKEAARVLATNLTPKVIAPQVGINEASVDTALDELSNAGLIEISKVPYIEINGRRIEILGMGDESD